MTHIRPKMASPEIIDNTIQEMIQVAMTNRTQANGNIGHKAEIVVLVLQAQRLYISELENRLDRLAPAAVTNG